MQFRLLGNSGLRVSEICLGAMTFGKEWGWGADKAESHKMLDAFFEAGGNFIDTANLYTDGTSERFLGDFLASNRQEVVLATKYTLSMHPDDPNAGGNQRKNMVQSIEESLKRLQTDYIDLYWVHAWDPFTPIEETLRGLDDLVRSGKVLYVGFSDAPAWVVAQANTIAELRGWSKFCGIQIEYSLIERTPERELLPMANALGIGVTAWSPLGSGILTGKYTVGRDDNPRRISSADTHKLSERNLEIARTLDVLSDQLQVPQPQLALKWLIDKGVTPIVGARNCVQLRESLGVLELRENQIDFSEVDLASRVELGFPHDFLAREAIRNRVYGNTFQRIVR